MPAKVLIAAQALAAYAKGDIVSVLPDGAEFGAKEALPNFIRLNVSDATKAQADAYLVQWKKRFVYTIDNQNAQGYRCTVEVDPLLLDASGTNAEVKQELKNFILAGGTLGLNVSFVAQTSNSLQVDIEKPADLNAFKNDINDVFEEVTNFSQFYFSETDVDGVIGAGGEMTRTKAQVNEIIKDRLAD